MELNAPVGWRVARVRAGWRTGDVPVITGHVPALSAVRQRCLAPNCFNIVIDIIIDMFPSFLLIYIKIKIFMLVTGN